ncbi:MAG: polyphosphate kinase 1 [Chitinophagaceae bacterium]|nr:polyphosphate kinase 1 [Chitinophagaceae bacterium]
MVNKSTFVQRDISWLSFNARVLQEANDPTVPINQRIRFLGIFSNNMDEFFRVRVATLKRMAEFRSSKTKLNLHMEDAVSEILVDLLHIVLKQQSEFDRIWVNIQTELKKNKVFLKNDQQLTRDQKSFVIDFFEKEVRSNIIPLMIESLPELPYLRDKSIYLGVVMQKKNSAYKQQYALIEIPSKTLGRFVKLPTDKKETHIILLEDIVRVNLPYIFSYFGYDHFEAHIFKVTKDAELDLDNDISTSLVEKMQKGLKKRRKGKPVRFVYDKEMNSGLLNYLTKKLKLNSKSSIIPGGRIHNFKHFMDFPDVFPATKGKMTAIPHPDLNSAIRVTDVIGKKDVLLHFPYHSFNAIIDLLREAAIDPDVKSIKITAYRLASESKVINALVNAARNGKKVEVMLELKARFDEEANLEWKTVLEEEGVKVILGIPNMKVHAKVCIINKRVQNKTIQYGFVSTGNLNEKTAHFYGDHCLLTSNRNIMADINRIFYYLENPVSHAGTLEECKTLLVSPVGMRKKITELVDKEIKEAKKGFPASITLKLNSLSDVSLIEKLNQASVAGVEVNLIIRGIYSAKTQIKKKQASPYAISIVDEYLEHARILVFHNGGNVLVYISSADWMVRNLDHRVEAACPIVDNDLKKELLEVLKIQLSDNVKARILDPEFINNYVSSPGKKRMRSQQEIYNYLVKKQPLKQRATGGN